MSPRRAAAGQHDSEPGPPGGDGAVAEVWPPRIRTILTGLHHEPWARLASDADYYDQSHMTAHFHEVMHVTPTAFAAGRLPTIPC